MILKIVKVQAGNIVSINGKRKKLENEAYCNEVSIIKKYKIINIKLKNETNKVINDFTMTLHMKCYHDYNTIRIGNFALAKIMKKILKLDHIIKKENFHIGAV